MLTATLNKGEAVTITVNGQTVTVEFHRVVNTNRVRLGIVADKEHVKITLPQTRGGREVKPHSS